MLTESQWCEVHKLASKIHKDPALDPIAAHLLTSTEWATLSTLADSLRSKSGCYRDLTAGDPKNLLAMRALTRTARQWQDIEERVTSSAAAMLTGTPLSDIGSPASSHPLNYPCHLLDGTTWVQDEPTLTRLLGHLFSPENPLRGIAFGHIGVAVGLFAKDRMNSVIEFVTNHPSELLVDTEVGGLVRGPDAKTKRRADLLAICKLSVQEPLPVYLLIEAKVRAKLDPLQLEETFAQVIDMSSFARGQAKFLTPFFEQIVNNDDTPLDDLSRKLETPALDLSFEATQMDLPSPWNVCYWTEIVAALELSRARVVKEPGIPAPWVSWLDMLLGVLWHGTLGIRPHRGRSLVKLSFDPTFQRVVHSIRLFQ